MTDPVERARMLVAVGRFREAIGLLHTSGDDAARTPSARCVLAQAHLGLDEPEPALEAADAALVDDPEHLDALRFRAAALSTLGRHREAVESADAAVRTHPTSSFARMTLASCQVEAGDGAGATRSAAEAVTLAPADASTHALAGLVALKVGDLDTSEAHLRHSLALDPNRADALNNLGVVGLRRGEYAEAEQRFLGAVQLTGSDTMADNVIRARRADRFQRSRWWRTPLLFVGFGACTFVLLAFSNPWPGVVLSGLLVGGLWISVQDPTGTWANRARAAGRFALRCLPAGFVAIAIAGFVDGRAPLGILGAAAAIGSFAGVGALVARWPAARRPRRTPIAVAREAALVIAGGLSLWALAARDDPYVLTNLVTIGCLAYLGLQVKRGHLRLSPAFRRILRGFAIVVVLYMAVIVVSVPVEGDPWYVAAIALAIGIAMFELQRFLRPARHRPPTASA